MCYCIFKGYALVISPPSNAEVKNAWCVEPYIYSPNTPLRRGA